MFKKFYYFFLCLLCVPLLVFIGLSLKDGEFSIIDKFFDYSIKSSFVNTLVIIVVASLLALAIAFYFAYMISFHEFKYKKIIEIGLILPFAIPVYIGAYSYGAIFSPTAELYQLTNLKVDILSRWGLIAMYVLFLYPYIYLPLRAFFKTFSDTIYQNAQLFSKSQFRVIFKLLLPLSLPTMVGGLSFFLFEIFSDYGASKYFGVETFAQAINQAWFIYDDMALALAIILIFGLIIFCLLFIKQMIISNKRYYTSQASTKIQYPNLKIFQKLHFTLITILIAGFGFFIPVGYMIKSAVQSFYTIKEPEYFSALTNTIWTTMLISILIIIISITIVNYSRKKRQSFDIFQIGYMLPSIFVALFVYQSFIALQNATGLVITQSILIVIYAYIVRFISVANSTLTSGFSKLNPVHEQTAKLFAKSELQILTKIMIPQLRPAIISAILLIVLEISKELSLMLFLRPFGFETLATKAFTYANDERIIESSIYSLSIVSFCLVVILLISYIQKEKNVRD